MTAIGSASIGVTVPIPGRADASITLAWAAATDTGRKRAANEDSFIAVSPLFAVADGMGGHSAGDLASAAVVERLNEVVGTDFLPSRAIERALERATADIAHIIDDSDTGVGTTVTGVALTLQGNEACFVVFNIGDSRVYSFEQDELVQITVDHSVVQELVASGLLTREAAERHPDSNIITRAVGFNARPAPDFWTLPARTGLRLLVCSDGLTKELGDKTIRHHMAAGAAADKTTDALLAAALASGGRDNVTAIVVDVLDAPHVDDLGDTAPRPRAD